MTEKGVQKAAADFERSIELGFALDNRQTFAKYAAYVLDLKQRTGTKARTLQLLNGDRWIHTDYVFTQDNGNHMNPDSITTTESFYSHIIEENKAKAAECIADVLIRKKA